MCSRFHMLPQPYIYRWSPPGSPWRRPRRPCLGIRWWCVEPFVCQLCSHILYLMFCSPCSADMHTFHEQCVFYWWMSIFCEVVFKQVAFDLYMRGSGIRLGRHISIPVSRGQPFRVSYVFHRLSGIEIIEILPGFLGNHIRILRVLSLSSAERCDWCSYFDEALFLSLQLIIQISIFQLELFNFSKKAFKTCTLNYLRNFR